MRSALSLVQEAFDYATEVTPTGYTFTLHMASGREHEGAPASDVAAAETTGLIVFNDGFSARIDCIESIQVNTIR